MLGFEARLSQEMLRHHWNVSLVTKSKFVTLSSQLLVVVCITLGGEIDIPLGTSRCKEIQ